VDADVPAVRGNDDVATQGRRPMTVRQVQWMGERGAVGQPLRPYVNPAVAAGDHWAAVCSVPTAIALAALVRIFQRKHRGG
jgi:hypothetical protein